MLLEEIIGKYLYSLGVGKDILKKSTDHKGKKIDKLDFIKIKQSQKTLLREWMNKPPTGRICL